MTAAPDHPPVGEDPSEEKPHRSNYGLERDWSRSAVPGHQCTAHRKKDGERCKNAAIRGSNVCGYHGGNAPAVKAKASLDFRAAGSVRTEPGLAGLWG